MQSTRNDFARDGTLGVSSRSTCRTREIATSLERCIDETGERLATLGPYPNANVAFALRVHLGALLQVMLESGDCTAEEVRGFLQDLEDELLGEADDEAAPRDEP